MNLIVWDIETGPLPKEDIIDMLPPFNPDDVRIGNLKDEVKIATKLAEAEKKHREDFFENAALNPMTGQVLCIGALVRDWDGPDEIQILGANGETEAEIISTFWDLTTMNGVTNELVGFNCNSFDLPFLYRRSWRYGIIPPIQLRNGRYWNKQIVDLREDWLMGDYRGHGSLDAIAKFLGVKRKTGNGKDFARLWAEDRPAAIAYARGDIETTTQIYDRIHKVAPAEWA